MADESSKLRPTISRKRLDALMNPRTRHLLDSRLVRVEWLMGERWDPWFSLRIYRLGGFSAHLEVGRLYVRWAPIKRADWRRMKQEGKRGRKFRNASRARFSSAYQYEEHSYGDHDQEGHTASSSGSA